MLPVKRRLRAVGCAETLAETLALDQTLDLKRPFDFKFKGYREGTIPPRCYAE